METEELKERYKILPMWARLSVAALIGVLPAIYVYYDEGDGLQAELEQVTGEEEVARLKFEKAREKKTNVPKLEEKLAFTEEQLVKAKKKLPDNYRIEDVLQKAATIAKEVGVRFVSFDPGDEKRGLGDYKYMEMPIATEIEGRFNQIAAFIDRVVHLEASVFVRNVALEPAEGEDGLRKKGQGNEAAIDAAPSFEEAQRSRSELRVQGKVELVIFRGMSEAEAVGADMTLPEGEVPADNQAVPQNAPTADPGVAAPLPEAAPS